MRTTDSMANNRPTPEEHPRPWLTLAFLSVATLLSLAVWFGTNAVAPALSGAAGVNVRLRPWNRQSGQRECNIPVISMKHILDTMLKLGRAGECGVYQAIQSATASTDE
jgi:hypothetical protein